MKTEKKQKFSLEKFEVAKLKNMHLIRGGDDTVDTITNTGTQSTADCVSQQPDTTPKPKTPKPIVLDITP